MGFPSLTGYARGIGPGPCGIPHIVGSTIRVLFNCLLRWETSSDSSTPSRLGDGRGSVGSTTLYTIYYTTITILHAIASGFHSSGRFRALSPQLRELLAPRVQMMIAGIQVVK